MKSLKAREKARPLSAMNHQMDGASFHHSEVLILLFIFFDGISFKNIGIIKKGAPLLGHTYFLYDPLHSLLCVPGRLLEPTALAISIFLNKKMYVSMSKI